ncbi:hypothetical protein [Actinokineospora xionganensis]|uniref:Uncharacterized protein n=1 Tax=Actinokineospora xionganensis TaxID=2684470 RepID=A0ABR7L964_9PSEU|nr:hypothetical protein [Actinokineospora xionganensis]MBC6449222.1 hypothetical protein [Actinokineospora xionganensis]
MPSRLPTIRLPPRAPPFGLAHCCFDPYLRRRARRDTAAADRTTHDADTLPTAADSSGTRVAARCGHRLDSTCREPTNVRRTNSLHGGRGPTRFKPADYRLS